MITGPWLVSWPVVATTLAASFVFHFAGSPDLPHGNVAVRIVAVVMSTAAMFGVLVVSAPVRRVPGWWGVVGGLAFILLAGAVRGIFLQYLLFWFGAATSTDFAYRLPAGVTTMSLVTAAASAAVGAVRQRAQWAATAERLQLELADEVQALDTDLQVDRDAAAQRIMDDLRNQLQTALGSSQTAVAELNNLAENVVRPMSHALAAQVPSVPTFTPATQAVKVRPRDVIGQIRPADGLNPLWLALIPGLMALPALWHFYGVGRIPLLLAVIGGTAAIAATILRALVRRMFPEPSPGVTVLVLTACLVICGVALTSVVTFTATRVGVNPTVVTTGVFVLPLVGWIAAIVAGMRRSAALARRQIDTVTEELRWTRARTAAVMWQQQGELSRALHGPVQSAIHASVRKLGPPGADGEYDPNALQTAGAELEETLLSLTAPDQDAVDVRESLDRSQQLWHGVADVATSLDDAAATALSTDPVAAGLVLDLAVEATSNAIRHGEASVVDIRISRATASTLVLSVRENGKGFMPRSGSGLGVEVLTRCSIDVTRTSTDGWHEVSAVLPLDVPVPTSGSTSFSRI